MIKNKKGFFAVISFSLIFLCNPSVNIIDILPDFIPYILLASLIGKIKDMLPYFAEVRSCLIKLFWLNLAKIPAAIVMFLNLHTGRDIIPLFTLIFAIFETILIINLVNNLFSALFYLGERSSSESLILPFSAFGKSVKPETLKNLTVAFAVIKAALNFIPELCVLTYSKDSLAKLLFSLYPVLIITFVLISLVLGILWVLLSRRYLKVLKSDDGLFGAHLTLTTKDRLDELALESATKRKRAALTLLWVSSIFSLDLTFTNISPLPLIPHIIWYVTLFIAVLTLADSKITKTLTSVFAFFASVFSLFARHFTSRFYESFELRDLLYVKKAGEAYLPIEIFSTLETVFALALLTLSAIILIRFIRGNTGIKHKDTDKTLGGGYSSSLIRKAVLLFTFGAAASVCKCINVFLTRNVRLLYSDAADVTKPVIEASPLPWFDLLIFALSLLFIFFSFTFIGELKEEYDSFNK